MLGKTAIGFSRFAVRGINLLIQDVASHFVKYKITVIHPSFDRRGKSKSSPENLPRWRTGA
jgi:hypothetical protein